MRRSRPWYAAWLVAMAGGLFAQGCTRSQSAPSAPASLVRLSVGVPITRQSGVMGLSGLASIMASEGLTTMGGDGRPVPRLAQAWTRSADGLTWHFRLRPNVTFHDGTRLDANAVKSAIDTARRNDSDQVFRPSLHDVAGVDVTSPVDLTIRLRSPSGFLLSDLSDLIISHGNPGPNASGTGPFSIVSRSADTIVLRAHRSYYLGRPAVDEIVLRSYDTLRAAWVSMMRGSVDMLYEVGQDSVQFVSDESSVVTRSYLAPYVYAVVFNERRNDLRDRDTRRALNLAVDRENIIEQVLRGRGVAARVPLWPKHWAYDDSLPAFRYDPAEAKRLLDARPRVGPPDVPGAPLTFTCLVPEHFTIYERMALVLQRQLADVGVDMRLESVETNVFNQRIAEGRFDAVLLWLAAGSNPSFSYRFWHSPGVSVAWNYWRYRDDGVDAAFDGLRLARDEAAEARATHDLARALHDDPPAIFVAWSERMQAVSRRFQFTSLPNRDLAYAFHLFKPAGPEGARR